jgi:OmpA-OmpF porin, OOP family
MKQLLVRAIVCSCWMGVVVLGSPAYGRTSVEEPLGEKFNVPNLLVNQQARVVFYRLDSDKKPGAISVYIDGAYQSSLQRGAFTELCLAPGKIEVGARMTENGQTVPEAYDLVNTLTLQPGKEVFVHVFEEINGQALMMTEIPEKALPKLVKTREQQHTISRVAKAQVCQDAPRAEPKPESKSKAISPLTSVTLGADALFPFAKSDVDAIAPRGRRILDHLVDRIRSEFGAGKAVNIHITGHADSFGTDQGNLRLSKARAEAIKAYFVSSGLLAQSISTDGRGDNEPVIKTCAKALTAANVACNKPNRRVVVEVNSKQPIKAND